MRRDTLQGALFAEFVGTTILILFGNGVVANVLYGTRLGSPEAAPFSGYNWNTITFGWAFAVVMAVYVAGGITGAHINPAVTLAAIARGGIDAVRGAYYIGAQVLGAIFGSLLVYLTYYDSFEGDAGYKNAFYTAPAAGYTSDWVHYFAEFIGTFMLVLFVYAIVDNIRNVGPGANLWPFMVGMAVLAIGLSLGGPTGYAINPARDFGPRVFAAIVPGDDAAFDGSYFLVPIIGPLVGGVCGALFYDFALKPLLPLPKEEHASPEGADVTHAELGVTTADD